MALTAIRFDMRQPGVDPSIAQRAYACAVEMAEWADQVGFDTVVLSEHHASPDGYLPSPLVLGAAIAARTKRVPITIAALLVPLHYPIRLAEDLAVLDLISNGRFSVVTGLGYRTVEYDLLGKDWGRRGQLLDECLDIMIKAWTGEPFVHNGTTVQVTPRPVQQPHPMVFIGGSAPASAKRAARFGLGFYPPVDDPELVEIYRAECERLGQRPGFVILPGGPGTVFIASDPDKAWTEIGPYLLHDAIIYRDWQTDDVRSHVSSKGSTIDELRTEGVYQILTPDECVVLATETDPNAPLIFHPLCGGIPPDRAWESLELFARDVMPRLT
jgi:alkanesulfonate monooxygenase SsuD/methylene tetrahydromethanopterin reductase-like flavin-dependent oxidoreductase (luciferase family)